jgi:hypothetical protein
MAVRLHKETALRNLANANTSFNDEIIGTLLVLKI